MVVPATSHPWITVKKARKELKNAGRSAYHDFLKVAKVLPFRQRVKIALSIILGERI